MLYTLKILLLENLDSNFTLLKDAYEESKKLFEIKILSWHGSITLHIKNIRGLKELSNVSKHKFKSSNKDVIYQVYKENWGKQMLKHSEGKLCS
jgi:tRNA A37 threonylcarbamoyladenosine synthetase subunit TsaC/SUA5/YrdC